MQFLDFRLMLLKSNIGDTAWSTNFDIYSASNKSNSVCAMTLNKS